MLVRHRFAGFMKSGLEIVAELGIMEVLLPDLRSVPQRAFDVCDIGGLKIDSNR
jgi:hypothetical protein